MLGLLIILFTSHNVYYVKLKYYLFSLLTWMSIYVANNQYLAYLLR